MSDKYILDTPIWIEIERKNKPIIERIKPYIENNQVILVDLIIAEVLRCVRFEKDFIRLKKAFLDFDIYTTEWFRVANLAWLISKKGYQPPLSDVYIAAVAIDNKFKLITLDTDFKSIAKVTSLSCQLLSQNNSKDGV